MAISISFPFSWAAQLGPSLSGCWFSLPHLISNSSDPPNSLNFLCTELYNSSMPTQSLMHFRRLWNGMFDCHRVEITVMQFTGHSLPVHQFVTVPWDFNPVPYCQPSSPMPMEYTLPPSWEWHVWLGQRSIYYNCWKIEQVTQVQILNEVVSFFFCTNVFYKDMNPSLSSSGGVLMV